MQIVPKDLFCKADTTLHIGKEYGIFINTTNEADYYASTVLVFDININTDLQATNDTIILSVKQIIYLPIEQELIIVKIVITIILIIVYKMIQL